MVVSERRAEIVSRYALVRDGVPVSCDAVSAVTGADPPVVYGNAASMLRAVHRLRRLGDDVLWYLCHLAEGVPHFHVCPAGLATTCRVCLARPGVPCRDIDSEPDTARVWLESPHPNRGAMVVPDPQDWAHLISVGGQA